MFITFVTLFVWISSRISMLPLISIPMRGLITLFTFIGCAECSIFINKKLLLSTQPFSSPFIAAAYSLHQVLCTRRQSVSIVSLPLLTFT